MTTGPKDVGVAERMSVPDGKSPLGRVRGLGAAGHGGEHWIRERLSSAALLLLGVWLLASLLMLPDLDQRTLREWLATPLGAVPMALFIVTAFGHSLDGLKVVIDDYQHDEGGRLLLLGLSLFLHVGAGALALFALARIAFGAAE